MAHEGMVHALEEIHRILKPDGYCIEIHPIPEGYLIEVLYGEKTLFSEPKRETCSDDVIHAEQAIAQVIEHGLFAMDQRAEFDFLTYAASVSELRAYWEEQSAFDERPSDEAVLEREKIIFSRVEAIMQTPGPGKRVAVHEIARITRLKPLK